MLRINKETKILESLEQRSMREAGYWERRDIQDMICRSPEAFCDELGENICVVGAEVQPSDFVADRIDLLAVDSDGLAVVIEIKRDSHKLHLLQALAYVGMIAKWEPRQFMEQLQKFGRSPGTSTYENRTLESAREELQAALASEDVETINRDQRIILLAEDFDYEVLVTAEWLTERYDVDIRCYRLALARHGSEEFLTCARSYPPPELTDLAIRRKRKRETGEVTPSEWPEVIESLTNKSVAKFFEEQLRAHRKNSDAKKMLAFDLAGKRRFTVYAKREWARVRQVGRFDHDVEFWKKRLTDNEMKIANDRLVFYLVAESDFDHFKQAMEGPLNSVSFSVAPDSEVTESDDANGE